MIVVMVCGRVWQDAGRERMLNIGETFDLPDVVAHALIATGAAKHLEASAPESSAPAEPTQAPRSSAPKASGKR